MLTALFFCMLMSIYAPPVDYPISLAGNFGEPRPHHFHGGLDIKTDGREGKHIYAIADGYVSRVTQGLYGFGNAVYITHPDGHTSVYCHLRSFSPRIKSAMRRYQYAHETNSTDVRFSPLECPVSQGQFIALSGNTGNSSAPHLHLEIHDTRTWHMLDPYPFLNDDISDTIPPQAHNLMACPQQGQGIFNGGDHKQTFAFTSHNLQRTFTAWGKVGFAIWANDYMQGSYNHYGIRETVLRCDSQEIFRAVVDRIPVGMNRLVNSWGDYDHWLHYRVWYLKSFVEPGNTLPILHADAHRGIIDFAEERDYHLEYLLRDYKGNESRYAFTVRGLRPTAPFRQPNITGKVFRWNQTNSYSEPGMQLVVPYGLLAADIVLHPVTRHQPNALSDAYTFSPRSLPLTADGEIAIYARLDNIDAGSIVHQEADPSKLYIRDTSGRYFGGEYRDGWVSGRIRELGLCYQVGYDDTPPAIRPVSISSSRIAVSITDGQSGLASFRATIDDRFVCFDVHDKSPVISCDLDETPLRKTGTAHRLTITATDNRQNTQTYETNIIY